MNFFFIFKCQKRRANTNLFYLSISERYKILTFCALLKSGHPQKHHWSGAWAKTDGRMCATLFNAFSLWKWQCSDAWLAQLLRMVWLRLCFNKISKALMWDELMRNITWQGASNIIKHWNSKTMGSSGFFSFKCKYHSRCRSCQIHSFTLWFCVHPPPSTTIISLDTIIFMGFNL